MHRWRIVHLLVVVASFISFTVLAYLAGGVADERVGGEYYLRLHTSRTLVSASLYWFIYIHFWVVVVLVLSTAIHIPYMVGMKGRSSLLRGSSSDGSSENASRNETPQDRPTDDDSALDAPAPEKDD